MSGGVFYDEKEIFKSINLCEENGTLKKEGIGWSRNPVYTCNLSGKWLRKKKWNYWCVNNDECLFSVTISNLDYAGMIFIYFLDFNTKQFIEKAIKTPFGRGCQMPDIVHETITFNNSKFEIEMAERINYTHIVVKCKNFNGHALDANFKAHYPDNQETLNVVIPWNKKSFQFTSKHAGLPVDGYVKLDDKQYNFNEDNTFACLDYGRGIWPRKISWNWATASGIADGRRIGLNLGAKWTEGTGITENGIFIDGKLIKISEDISFEYDNKDYMKPWTIKTINSDMVSLELTPFFERIASTNLLIIKSEFHQLIGHIKGIIKINNEAPIIIKNIIGCVEDHYAKW